MTRVCLAILATIIATSAQADDSGFNNTPGWSDGGTDGNIKYYHGADGTNGWQTNTGSNTYFHSDKGNCWSNVGAVTQTTCIPY